jgi:hypothetical protein
MVELAKSAAVEMGRPKWNATGAGAGYLLKSPEGKNFFVDTRDEVIILVTKEERKREGRNGAHVVELHWSETNEVVIR